MREPIMRKNIRIFALVVLTALVVAACDDGKSSSLPTPAPTDSGGSTSPTDPAVDGPDASTQQSYLLTEWVDGLVEERSSDSADPDTVDDKQIVDTDDPAAFDKYL